MKEFEKTEIDSLLSAIADEGADDAKLRSLEALLIDRPDLQDYYAQRQTMHAVLSLEFSVVRGPVAEFRAAIQSTLESQPDDAPTPVAARRRRSKRGSTRRSWASAFLPQICAAAVAAAFLGGLAWSLRLDQAPPAAAVAIADDRAWSSAPQASGSGPGLVMHDRGSLRLLEKLTRHPMITNVLLPRVDGADGATSALCSGNAWFERVQNDRERGYLVALPAGCKMEVTVDTEAASKNSLAVVEVNPTGLTTGEALVFDNTAAFNTNSSDWQPPGKRDVGQIGAFSEKNNSSLTKYYLFTASYSLPDLYGEEHWRQSDFRIQFDAEDLMVIGWDDSGYDGPLEDAKKITPDRDFNDMRAVLKFSFPERKGLPRLPVSHFLPDPIDETDSEQLPDTPRGYVLDLLPGEEALLSVTSEARYQNSFLIIDTDSKRVLWKHDGLVTGEGVKQPSERGIYVIRNLTDHVQRYEVCGRHKIDGETEADPWRPSPFQVSDIGAGAVTVGFEDSPESWKRVDWKDLRVFIKVFSP